MYMYISSYDTNNTVIVENTGKESKMKKKKIYYLKLHN